MERVSLPYPHWVERYCVPIIFIEWGSYICPVVRRVCVSHLTIYFFLLYGLFHILYSLIHTWQWLGLLFHQTEIYQILFKNQKQCTVIPLYSVHEFGRMKNSSFKNSRSKHSHSFSLPLNAGVEAYDIISHGHPNGDFYECDWNLKDPYGWRVCPGREKEKIPLFVKDGKFEDAQRKLWHPVKHDHHDRQEQRAQENSTVFNCFLGHFGS